MRTFTVHSAIATFEEDAKGTIEPGKLADFVVLSANPLATAPEAIQNIRVEQTWIGKRELYDASRPGRG